MNKEYIEQLKKEAIEEFDKEFMSEKYTGITCHPTKLHYRDLDEIKDFILKYISKAEDWNEQ